MDLISLMAGINALKFGKEILNGLLKTKIEAEARDKISEALERLVATQDAFFALRDENLRLQSDNYKMRKQISAYEKWEVQITQYSLGKTRGGAVVYISKGTPKHYACPSCAAKRKIEILQDIGALSGEFLCPGCKNTFPIDAPKYLDLISDSKDDRNLFDH